MPVERLVKETVTVRDTVVNVRIEQVRDSVVIPLAKDTASFLENAYAYSYAIVTQGDLVHSLGTQKASFPVKTEYIEVIRTDSIPYLQVVTQPAEEVIIRKPGFLQVLKYVALGIVTAFALMAVYLVYKK